MEPLSLTRKEIWDNQFNVHNHQLIETWINFHLIDWHVSVHKSSDTLKIQSKLTLISFYMNCLIVLNINLLISVVSCTIFIQKEMKI